MEHYAIGGGEAISVSTEKARTGKKSLRIDGGATQSLSQILDRGFLPGKQSFRMEGWVWTDDNDRNSKLLLEFDINDKDGSERVYRVPVELHRGGGWRNFSAEVGLDSNKLKFTIFRIQTKDNIAPVYLDDLKWVFLDHPEAAIDGTHRIDGSTPLQNCENKNLARGQLVIASSFFDNDWPPANAVNGLHSSDDYARKSAWHSQRPASNQWLKIYLPRTYRISRIRLLNSSAPYPYRTKDFRIEISTNDLDYSVAAEGQLPNNGNEWIELDIKETVAKYVKFVGVTGYHPDYAIGLQEMEIY
jgi:alpha-glucosidase (family GH31 glycosyl hydrolase)